MISQWRMDSRTYSILQLSTEMVCLLQSVAMIMIADGSKMLHTQAGTKEESEMLQKTVRVRRQTYLLLSYQ